MSTDNTLRRKRLSRAWRHLLSHSLFGHKGRAAKVFGLGLLTMIIQLGAVLAIVGAARAWDNEGVLAVRSFSLDLLAAPRTIWIYGGVTLTLLGLSIAMGLYNRIIVTRIGRRFFEEKLVQTRGLIAQRIREGKPYSRSDSLAYLSRDCRFLSVSYTRILLLIQPALLLLGLLIATAFIQPLAAAVMLGLGLVVLPAHLWLIGWAQRTSDALTATAKAKSSEEQAYIDHLAQSPLELNPEQVKGYHGGPGQDGFLGAFVKRQRMSTFSQTITDMMSLGILIAFGVVLLFGVNTSGAIGVGSLVLLFILWRFLSAYMSTLAQAVTMVSSYEPFFRGLLDFQRGETENEPGENVMQAFTIDGEITQPLRLAIFQKEHLSREVLAPLSEALGRSVKLVSHNFTLKPEDLDGQAEHFERLDADTKDEVKTHLENPDTSLSARAQLLLSMHMTPYTAQDALLLDGQAFSTLAPTDLRHMLRNLGHTGLILIYRGLPNRLALPPRFQISGRSGPRLSIVGQAHEFQTCRAEIKTLMDATQSDRQTAKSGLSEEIIQDEF